MLLTLAAMVALVVATGLLESNRYGATKGAGGDHLHTLTVTAASTGGGATHDNIPPYYALAHIMKS